MVDTSPDALKEVVGGFAVGNIGDMIVTIGIWTLITIGICLFLGIIYVLIMFRIKATIYHVSGSGDIDNNYTIRKKSTDYIQQNKDGSWTWLFRKFKREEKFNDKYMYGNNVIAFKVGTKYFPGRTNLQSLDTFNISPVPFDVRKKIELECQQIEVDLRKQDFWNNGGKQMVITLLFALLVIAFAFAVIWIAFAKTNTQIPHMDSLTEALKGFGEMK